VTSSFTIPVCHISVKILQRNKTNREGRDRERELAHRIMKLARLKSFRQMGGYYLEAVIWTGVDVAVSIYKFIFVPFCSFVFLSGSELILLYLVVSIFLHPASQVLLQGDITDIIVLVPERVSSLAHVLLVRYSLPLPQPLRCGSQAEMACDYFHLPFTCFKQ
jgi:hypothetical protein